MMEQRDVVVGVFDDRASVRDAVLALKDAGFSASEISILMPDGGGAAAIDHQAAEVGDDAVGGAIAGGLLGGLTGWLLGVAALAIPGVGPFVAAGAFATALSGAAIGAGVGAVGGALVGMGVPEHEASFYEEQLRGGRTLIAVRATGRLAESRDILREFGAYDIRGPGRRGVTAAALPTEVAGNPGPAAGLSPPEDEEGRR